MAKYRLLSKHYINDRVLDEGTIVGDDTAFPVPECGVTPEMEGLDAEGKAEVQKVIDAIPERMNAAPQLGQLYLDPEVRTALIGLSGTKKPDPLPTTLPKAPTTKEETPSAKR